MCARSTVDYLTGGGEGYTTQFDYIMHPITIDSLLQTALVASSAGTIGKLACIVPTCVEHAQFTPPVSGEGSEWFVDAVSKPTGLGSLNIAAELHDGHGTVCAQMENVSAVAFQGVQEDESAIDERHPMMKVIWKPDITKLTSADASGFADHLAKSIVKDGEAIPVNLQKLAEMVAIYAHKNPRINILELGNKDGVFARHVLDVLRAESAFPRMASYSRGYLKEGGDLFVQNIHSISKVEDNMDKAKANPKGTAYDLVVLLCPEAGSAAITTQHEAVGMLLTGHGAVVGLLPTSLPRNPDLQLEIINIAIDDEAEKIVVGKIPSRSRSRSCHHVVVVERGNNTTFNDALCA